MNFGIFDFFRHVEAPKSAASQAKERLQIMLAHERGDRSSPDFLPKLQDELLQVIAKYVSIDADKVAVKLDRGLGVSMLEVNIELPAPSKSSAKEDTTKETAPKQAEPAQKNRKAGH